MVLEPQILQCPRELRGAALQWLHEALPQEQKGIFVQAIESTGETDSAWNGLLVVLSESSAPGPNFEALSPKRRPDLLESEIKAAAWLQQLSGNTAVLWIPPGENVLLESLLHRAAQLVDSQVVPLAQLVVGENDGYSAELNRRCGFPKFAELAYLFAQTTSVPGQNQETRRPGTLDFVPFAGDQPQRLAELLEQTYIGTLDCPGLDGVRAMSDVLEGYRSQGRHTPGNWYFVREKDVDVGALILADHPSCGNCEVVYMGVVPEARGRGFGEQMMRFALQVAAEHGAERLVLAVDADNAPALAAYRRAGFSQWDRRIVYARLQQSA
jgi:ribosomal protein S18 acetylase RimI-like enzyme